MNTIINGSITSTKNLLGGSGAYASLAAAFFHRPVELLTDTGKEISIDQINTLANKGIVLTSLKKWEPKPARPNEPRTLLALTAAPPKTQLDIINRTFDPALIVTETDANAIKSDSKTLQQVIARSGLVILTHSDATALTGSKNAIEAGEKIIELGTQNVAITLGENGTILVGKDQYGNENLFRGHAYPSRNVVDPTGMSDTLIGATAGLLASRGNATPGFGDFRETIVRAGVLASFTSEGQATAQLQATSYTDYERRLDHLRSITHW